MSFCKPAIVYLSISVIAIVILIYQNIGSRDVYCLGAMRCDVKNIPSIFAAKILYVIFFTWILNLICKSGGTEIAWFLVFLPLLFFFISILYFFAV